MTGPVPDATSSSGLRAALLAAPQSRGQFTPPPARDLSNVPPPPSAPELLDSSPNLQRLCESYHRAHTAMVRRSRRQRIGIGMLVGAMGVASVYLKNAGLLNPQSVANLILTVAGASCLGLAIMATLWMRDDRRLRGNQGERLLRAIAFNCDLPGERLEALQLGLVPSSQTFLDCYDVWRAQHTNLRDGFPILFRSRAA
ncbi:MAG TPA: hypothetical protein VI316_12350 [Candidatus Dormibacteraeota bacterium]